MSAGCEKFETLLLRLPDGDFTDAEADSLREHLSTCRDCRRLFRALEAASDVLEDELAEPPAELANRVMERVYAAKTEATVKNASARRAKASSKRRWRNIAVAASLVIVVGGAVFLAKNLLSSVGSSSQVAQSISLENIVGRGAEPAAAPMPEPEEAAMDIIPAAEAEVPAEEAAEAENALAAAADAGADEAVLGTPVTDWPATSWMEPAQVPEGREEDFEAVITDSHQDASMTNADWDVVAYVEYHGVIYEFLTYDGVTLLWRDAAEGLFPCISPLPAEALRDILY